MTRSRACCWTPSPPGRSPWRCPPPMRWQAGTSGPAGPPSSPSSAPATTPTGPSGPSAPASRRTGWSPAAWKPAGRPGSPRSPRPSRRSRPPTESLPPLPSRAELGKLAADLPALWHAPTTSTKDRKRLLRTLIADITLLPEPDRRPRSGSGSAGTPAPPTSSAWPGPSTPAPPGVARPPPSSWSASSARSLRTAELAGQLNAAGPDPPATAGHSTSRPCSGSATPTRSRPPTPYGRRRDLRSRGRPPTRLQHQYHLPLDPHRPADRPPQLRQPVVHPLGQPQARPAARSGSQDPPAWAAPPALARCPPRPHPPPTARSASPKPPTSSAAASVSSTTGSTSGKLAARRGAGNRLHIPWNEHIQAQCRCPDRANPGTLTPPPASTKPRRPR